MKPMAKFVFSRLGFRRSLVLNGIFGTVGYGLCAAFRPDWPMPLVFVVLVLSAFFLSFQFTAYNTIAYDEIDKERMSSATSFYTTFQQLMQKQPLKSADEIVEVPYEPYPAHFGVPFRCPLRRIGGRVADSAAGRTSGREDA